MTFYDMPDWIKILLLILTCISFVPQLYALVRRRGDASGISPIYVFINLVAATELFTISFVITVNYPEPSSSFTHDPRQLGDWINFANITVIWALWLVIFIVCIVYYWHENRSRATPYVVFYPLLLIISIIPVVIDAIANAGQKSDPAFGRLLLLSSFGWVHLFFLIPLITLLCLLAAYSQAREILARPSGSGTGALSVVGVALQTVVFAVLAATWYPGRLPLTTSNPHFILWYYVVGFVPVNHAFVALEHGLLLVAVERHIRRGQDGGEGSSGDDIANVLDETQPLIGS
ncbi:hypothetical protein F4824DRAFT_460701 [Ustulina deusta]|nr:hypothetical protein F4824DRAFT_460701 [Ustulina deusta]